MRRIAMILIILLGSGAITYSVIAGAVPKVYIPGDRNAPTAQYLGDCETEDWMSDDQPTQPGPRNVSARSPRRFD